MLLLENKKKNCIMLMVLISLVIIGSYVYATPAGPTATLVRNETAIPPSAAIINTSGGSVTTMTLNVTGQNMKWKAFVGNVTGTLVLQDADGWSIYDWNLSSVVGEVYTSRSNNITWTNINCSNLTHITNEEVALNHTSNPDDNISATFSTKDHDVLNVGTIELEENACYSLHTNVDNQSQSTDFEEILLYDGTNHQDGDVVYATTLEQDTAGFDNEPYDFQMIVPEIALASWDSATAYYFYVELT